MTSREWALRYIAHCVEHFGHADASVREMRAVLEQRLGRPCFGAMNGPERQFACRSSGLYIGSAPFGPPDMTWREVAAEMPRVLAGYQQLAMDLDRSA